MTAESAQYNQMHIIGLMCFLCICIADIVAIYNSHGLSKVVTALHMLWEADAEASGQVTQQSG